MIGPVEILVEHIIAPLRLLLLLLSKGFLNFFLVTSEKSVRLFVEAVQVLGEKLFVKVTRLRSELQDVLQINLLVALW